MSRTSTSRPRSHATDPTDPTDLASWRQRISDAHMRHGHVWRTTPLRSSRALSNVLGEPVWLKCENLQRTGSFKFRGAYEHLARMLERHSHAPVVVAASAGNHGQAVALASRLLGLRCTVFMPEHAPRVKIAATREYGANVILTSGRDVTDAVAAARAFAATRGSVFVHPYDDVDVITGQGTVAEELLAQCPDLGTVVVPLGGGGLLAGITARIKATHPHVRLVGVQAAELAAYPRALRAGRPLPLDTSGVTSADGIAVRAPGTLPFGVISRWTDEVVTVSEPAIRRALELVLLRSKLLVEPAGAAGVAAVLDGQTPLPGPVIVVLSGGNVDAVPIRAKPSPG